jgi:hypothetical protein
MMAPVLPVVGIALGALAAALVVRNIAREWQRAKADVGRANETSIDEVKPEAIPKLRRDPKTGIYRP